MGVGKKENRIDEGRKKEACGSEGNRACEEGRRGAFIEMAQCHKAPVWPPRVSTPRSGATRTTAILCNSHHLSRRCRRELSKGVAWPELAPLCNPWPCCHVGVRGSCMVAQCQSAPCYPTWPKLPQTRKLFVNSNCWVFYLKKCHSTVKKPNV